MVQPYAFMTRIYGKLRNEGELFAGFLSTFELAANELSVF